MNLSTPEGIVSVAEKWKAIRARYPGWVVAPDKCREELWEFTQFWIDPVFSMVEQLTARNALFVLFELNWRLEVALCPLLIPQVEVIAKVLDAARGHGTPSEAGYSDKDKEHLVALSFALLREAREDLDSKRFDYWSSRVQSLIGTSAASWCRWHYEQCLFNLNVLKHRRVEEALQRWTPNADLPFWESKRASVLAELGAFKEAEEIAETALETIRSRLRPFVADYGLLSQEGFAMALVKAIRLQVRIPQIPGANENRQYTLRWNQLESAGCNPWIEQRILELAVTAPPPTFKAGRELTRGFDAGHVFETTHYVSQEYFYKCRPGFALLRFFEEGGIPLRCGTVKTSGDNIANAALWIEPFAPSWALATIFRADEEKAIERTFNRVRIATLTPKEVDTIFALMMEAAQEALNVFAAGTIHDVSFGGRLLPLICELLSRIAFRLDGERLVTLKDFTLTLYGIPSRSFDSHDCLLHLFYRILDAATPEQIRTWIPSLLSLPIPQDAGFEIHEHARRWPEPADYIPWKSLGALSKTALVEVQKTAENLIRLAGEGREQARKHAIARLAGLYKGKLLSAELSKAFGAAIWNKVDERRGLPENVPFYSFAFLDLPSPNNKTPAKRLHKWLLGDIPEVVTTHPAGANQGRPTYGGGAAAGNFFHNLRGASARVWLDRPDSKHLRWTSEDLKILVQNLARWWSREKAFLPQFSDVRRHMEDFKAVLSQVILPRLKKTNSVELDAIQTIFVEMSAAGIPALALLVGLEKHERTQSDIERRITTALWSDDREQVVDALDAIFMWCFYSKRDAEPESANKLVRALVSRVVVLREPSLRESIFRVRDVVRYMPQAISPENLDLLLIALAHLLSETKLVDDSKAKFSQSTATSIVRDEKPIIRTASASLAAAVLSLCQERSLIPQEIITEWKVACENDVLPEVRKAWRSPDE